METHCQRRPCGLLSAASAKRGGEECAVLWACMWCVYVHQWWAISIGGRLLKSVILSIGYNPTAKKTRKVIVWLLELQVEEVYTVSS